MAARQVRFGLGPPRHPGGQRQRLRVDAAALNGAPPGRGEVVSVLGNGIDVTYPAYHEDLYADVAAAGALLSEYPPGTPAQAPIFRCATASLPG